MRPSEEQLKHLMVQGLEGNARAYHALLTLMAPMLRGFFSRRLRDAAEDVEDLVQETLIAIHAKRATYDPSRIFTVWFYAIARYKLVDHFRRARHHVSVDDLDAILAVEGFEDTVTARLDVTRLLDGLPDKQARAIQDTKIDGFSVAETSSRRRISEADVKVSVHRGLKSLSAMIRRH